MNATSAMIAARQAVSVDSENIPFCKIDPTWIQLTTQAKISDIM